jgi:hypothetical protein
VPKSVVVQQVRKMQQMLVQMPRLKQLVVKSVVALLVREIMLMLKQVMHLKSVVVPLVLRTNSKALKVNNRSGNAKGKKGRH